MWIVSGFVFAVGITFFAFFGWFFVVTPGLFTYQRRFFISNALLASAALTYFIILTYWRITDRPLPYLPFFCFMLRAASSLFSLYLSLVGLRYPLDVGLGAFLIAFLPFAVSSALEVYGVLSLASRTSGDWFFGFGAIPFLDFCLISVVSLSVFGFALKSSSEELSEDGKKRRFLILLFIVFIAYFCATVSLSLVRIGTTLTETRNMEWIAFAIHPLFLTGIHIVNGWFWCDFNPTGWNPIENGLQEDGRVSLLDDMESDSEPMPASELNLPWKNGPDAAFHMGARPVPVGDG
jgi:hypothetical protein